MIDGKALSKDILLYLKHEIAQQVKIGNIPPRLVIFSVKPGSATQAFMRNKRKAAQEIGAEFELILYKRPPRFENFMKHISKVSHRSDVHGVIIQEPLPATLTTATLVDYIPLGKEIEGFRNKSPFFHPIGLATLTAIKQTFGVAGSHNIDDILFDMDKDMLFLKNVLRRKKVVLIGRGKTGGAPIGKLLQQARISHINLNSKTITTAESFISQADIVISAVGKKVLEPHMLKPGAAVYSVGMHRENGVWKGDYDDDEIKDTVLAYIPTPGGIGPLNVAYLMYNLVKAWKIQNTVEV